MKTLIKNKKAGMSIPIVVLVLFTLVLVIVSLFHFSVRDKNNKQTLMIPSAIDELYTEEARLNFHLQNIFDKACENFQQGQGKEVFIENFKKELGFFKDKTDKYMMQGLEQVEQQLLNQTIIEKNLILDSKKLVLTLQINLLKSKIREKQDLILNYRYEKTFEKVFKG